MSQPRIPSLMRKSSRADHGMNLRVANSGYPAGPLWVSNWIPSEGNTTTDSIDESLENYILWRE